MKKKRLSVSILRERRPIAKRCIAAGLYQKLVNKLEPSFIIKRNMLVHLNHSFPKGEFLHVIHQARNVFIFVAYTSADGRRQALSAQDVDNLLCFQQALLPADLLKHAYRLAPFLIIAANDKNQYAHLNKKGFCFLSKMVLGNVVSLIKNNALAKASPAIQCRLQSVFSPETYIPKVLSSNAMPFLDQTQEKILKQSLCPTSYSSSYTSNTHLYQGTTGSGKTLVLLQRAKLLQQLNPTWKLLVIAPNIAALHALQKIQRVLNPEASIEILCFQHWCRRHIKDVLQFIYADEVFELAMEAVECHFKDHCLTAKQLLEELAYCADRAIDTLACYLATERDDTLFSLHHLEGLDRISLGVRIWEAMQDVAQALRLRNLHMVCDLAPLLWYQVLQGKVDLPEYDAIFIDDAHEFAPIGFKLLHRACKLTGKTSDDVERKFSDELETGVDRGHLFMMADCMQTNVIQTWREANIQAIEHETVLDQCYRSSIDILQLANKLYPLGSQTSAYNVRRKSTKCWRWPYKTPVLFHLTQEIDEIDLLVKEVSVLLDRGMQAKDILIVQAGQTPIRQLAMLLREQLDMTISVFGDPEYSEKTLYITALNTISAIESPVVFIVGLQHLFVTDAELETNESKLKRLYKGAMRAQHQLTLMLVADTIPPALQLKELNVIKNPTRKNNVYPLFPASVF
jgi:hypothetical protein